MFLTDRTSVCYSSDKASTLYDPEPSSEFRESLLHSIMTHTLKSIAHYECGEGVLSGQQNWVLGRKGRSAFCSRPLHLHNSLSLRNRLN